jgi:hypothetical protein
MVLSKLRAMVLLGNNGSGTDLMSKSGFTLVPLALKAVNSLLARATASQTRRTLSISFLAKREAIFLAARLVMKTIK